jgi:hypothetical protein
MDKIKVILIIIIIITGIILIFASEYPSRKYKNIDTADESLYLTY